MPRIITDRIDTWKMAPRRSTDPAGAQRISFISNHKSPGDDHVFQSVREVMIPSYAYPDFVKEKRIHYIELDSKPPIRMMIGIGTRLLHTEDLPRMTWYGRLRLRLWWTLQKLWGNV